MKVSKKLSFLFFIAIFQNFCPEFDFDFDPTIFDLYDTTEPIYDPVSDPDNHTVITGSGDLDTSVDLESDVSIPEINNRIEEIKTGIGLKKLDIDPYIESASTKIDHLENLKQKLENDPYLKKFNNKAELKAIDKTLFKLKTMKRLLSDSQVQSQIYSERDLFSLEFQIEDSYSSKSKRELTTDDVIKKLNDLHERQRLFLGEIKDIPNLEQQDLDLAEYLATLPDAFRPKDSTTASTDKNYNYSSIKEAIEYTKNGRDLLSKFEDGSWRTLKPAKQSDIRDIQWALYEKSLAKDGWNGYTSGMIRVKGKDLYEYLDSADGVYSRASSHYKGVRNTSKGYDFKTPDGKNINCLPNGRATLHFGELKPSSTSGEPETFVKWEYHGLKGVADTIVHLKNWAVKRIFSSSISDLGANESIPNIAMSKFKDILNSLKSYDIVDQRTSIVNQVKKDGLNGMIKYLDDLSQGTSLSSSNNVKVNKLKQEFNEFLDAFNWADNTGRKGNEKVLTL